MKANAEKQRLVTHYLNGYPSFAAFIASDIDKTSAIYKRYDRLAARNLLYLQSELAELQQELDDYDERDRVSSSNDVKKAARNWKEFQSMAKADPRRLELVLLIRSTMREYREALLFESTMASLPSPQARSLKAFHDKFYNISQASDRPFPTLGGASKTAYDDAEDLVALKLHVHQDRLHWFVQNHLGFLFRIHTPDGVSGNVSYISEHRIAVFVAWISTLLSAILLIGAIVVLYKVQDPDWTLALLAFFTSMFAGSVGLLTNARRAEVFGATAAYAAVLVVFVSGNLGSGNSGSPRPS